MFNTTSNPTTASARCIYCDTPVSLNSRRRVSCSCGHLVVEAGAIQMRPVDVPPTA